MDLAFVVHSDLIRSMHSSFTRVHPCQVRDGLATAAEMEAISFAWRSWAAEPNGVFYYTNGQAIATIVK